MDLKSSEPFWLIKNGLLNTYPSLLDDMSCDILIIGGGITGALIAHQCMQDGFNIILIDKREIANGSTSATTSMLQYEIDIPLYKLCELIGTEGAWQAYRACSSAIDKLAEISKQIRSSAGFSRKKSLYLSAKPSDTDWLHRECDVRQASGFDVKWLEMSEITERYGFNQGYGGILSEQGASVDAFKLVHELLQFNMKNGLQVYDRTELTSVKTKGRYNECKLSTGAIIKADKIIYCNGYESKSMIKENFVNLKSTFAIVSEVDSYDNIKDLLMWNTAKPYLYSRCTDDGRLLIGGEDENFSNATRRDLSLAKKAQKLCKSIEKLRPKGRFLMDFAWAGTFGETTDGLPYIGSHIKYENSYFVLGFGGNGITFSVIGMEMVSSWLKNEEHPLSPLFKFGR